MNTKVAAAFAVVISGLAGAYSLSIPADRKRPSTDSAAREPIDARSEALVGEIARLQRHQEPGVAPARGRDVFRFAAARAARPERVVPVVPSVPTERPVAPPRPVLKLIGVAEDSASGNPVRTAIISAPDQLYVVREGERVTSRFGVQRISPDVVELVDTVDASAVRLALK
jgi:hypothetical protein